MAIISDEIVTIGHFALDMIRRGCLFNIFHKRIIYDPAQILQGMELPVSAEFWFRKATKASDNKDEESAILFQKVRTSRLYGPMTLDFPVKVDFSQFGRSVIATEDIPEGTECFTDHPVAMAESMSNNLVPGCHHCAMSMLTPRDYFGDALDLFDSGLASLVKDLWPCTTPVYCKMCTSVIYCTEKCRDAAWKKYHEVTYPYLYKPSYTSHIGCYGF